MYRDIGQREGSRRKEEEEEEEEEEGEHNVTRILGVGVERQSWHRERTPRGKREHRETRILGVGAEGCRTAVSSQTSAVSRAAGGTVTASKRHYAIRNCTGTTTAA